jgi:hypothetical protein
MTAIYLLFAGNEEYEGAQECDGCSVPHSTPEGSEWSECLPTAAEECEQNTEEPEHCKPEHDHAVHFACQQVMVPQDCGNRQNGTEGEG